MEKNRGKNLQSVKCRLFFTGMIITMTMIPFFSLSAAASPSAGKSSVSAENKTHFPGTAVSFPAGTILSVQVSNILPEIREDDPRDPIPQNAAYVEIQAMLDAGRGSGRFDYTLKIRNKNYVCAAAAVADAPYSMNPVYWNIRSEKAARRIRFLFPVDKELVAQKQIKEAVLLFDLRRNQRKNTVLPLMFLPDGQTFSPPEQIPDTGICGLTFEAWQQQQQQQQNAVTK